MSAAQPPRLPGGAPAGGAGCATKRRSLADGVLDVWLADLEDDRPSAAWRDPLRLLSRAERERGGQIGCERRRERWVRSRALLRELLGSYLGIDPSAVPIVSAARGKPELRWCAAEAGPPTALRPPVELAFNCSHSGWLGLYAFAQRGAVGADVELPGRHRPVLALARRAFEPEQVQRLRSTATADRQRAFLSAWTRHEAVLKCSGAGLGGGTGAPPPPGAIWVANLDLRRGVAAALAAQAAPRVVRCRALGGRATAVLGEAASPFLPQGPPRSADTLSAKANAARI